MREAARTFRVGNYVEQRSLQKRLIAQSANLPKLLFSVSKDVQNILARQGR